MTNPCSRIDEQLSAALLPSRSSPRKRGPRAISAFTRVFNALCTRASPSLGPRFRGDERRMLLRPFSLFSCQRALGVEEGKRKSAPCFGFGPGDRPHSSHHTSLTSRGMARRQGARPGAPGRRWHGLRPALGVKTSRPAPCGAPTRHLRLTPQSAIGPHQELFVPGGFIPEAARGSGLRKYPPAGCRSRSPLSRRLMKTPSSMDRDHLHIE